MDEWEVIWKKVLVVTDIIRHLDGLPLLQIVVLGVLPN